MMKFLILLFVSQISLAADINYEKSKVSWKAYTLGGSSHEGYFKFQGNVFDLDKEGNIKKAYFIIKMDSLSVTDLEGDSKASLEKHLKSDDFFNVKKHPLAYFDAKKITAKKLEGELKLNGVTKMISLPYKREGKNFTAKLNLDRTDFNIRYGSGKFFKGLGDKAIKDKVPLQISITLQ